MIVAVANTSSGPRCNTCGNATAGADATSIDTPIPRKLVYGPESRHRQFDLWEVLHCCISANVHFGVHTVHMTTSPCSMNHTDRKSVV